MPSHPILEGSSLVDATLTEVCSHFQIMSANLTAYHPNISTHAYPISNQWFSYSLLLSKVAVSYNLSLFPPRPEKVWMGSEMTKNYSTLSPYKPRYIWAIPSKTTDLRISNGIALSEDGLHRWPYPNISFRDDTDNTPGQINQPGNVTFQVMQSDSHSFLIEFSV